MTWQNMLELWQVIQREVDDEIYIADLRRHYGFLFIQEYGWSLYDADVAHFHPPSNAIN